MATNQSAWYSRLANESRTLAPGIGSIGHFRSEFPPPLLQNEGKCSAFDMEMIFHSHANKTHFYKKGCTPSLILKVRVLELGSGLFSVNERQS